MNTVTNTQLFLTIGIPTLTVILTSIDLHLQHRKLLGKLDRWATRVREDNGLQSKAQFPTIEELFKGFAP
ncbi:MAG: hypothetical protein ABR910_05625 [Acidobacteriaceae bacterium]